MSETIATRIGSSTVWPVRRNSCVRALGPLAAAVLLAELGARLLSPAPPPLERLDVEASAYFSAEEIARGRRFSRPQLALALTREALGSAVLVLLVARSRQTRGRRWWRRRRRDSSPLARGAATAAELATLLNVIGLPLGVLARRRAIAVGLVTQSWGGWTLDLAKAAAIRGVMAGGAGAAAVGVTRRYPGRWWLPAAAGSVAAESLLGALAPVVLAPLFNRFEPLPDGETRRDVLEIASAAGAKVGQVYSVDASRRTTGANAYVAGVGPTKRVVLFDTLLSTYTRDEVRVVVAHELAHVVGRDVIRSLVFSAITAPAAAFAVQRLSWELSPSRGTDQALPALALAAMIVAAPVGIAAMRMSRAVERRADFRSLELTEAADAFVEFERRIALQNVADLDPPRWVSWLLSTHPPTLERIGMALAYARRG
jgi:STE24 endopeptidase